MFAKPYSAACDENKEPILAVLRPALQAARQVLEIGSGTGQHAVHFARALPHVTWQTSDVMEHHAGIQAWLAEAALSNVLPPLALDVRDAAWPVATVDAVYSANTAHIMSWDAVEAMFRGVGHVLNAGGLCCLYGPFNVEGTYTSRSNAHFDAWLKARDARSGLRDVAVLDDLARQAGLASLRRQAMPVNNLILMWRMT